MNVHASLPTAALAIALIQHDDRELIVLCNRAKELFRREKAAEQRVWAAQDGGLPEERPFKALDKATERLKGVLSEIVSIAARTPEGLAYKAAMLAPWLAAGFALDEQSIGYDLAFSIAQDARSVGIDAHLDLKRLRAGAGRRKQ